MSLRHVFITLKIDSNHRSSIAAYQDSSLIEHNAPSAKTRHCTHIVTYKQYGPPLLCDVTHFSQTLFLKRSITDGQHLVYNQDLRFQMGCNGESKAHVHTARISLNWGIDELFHFRKGDDLIELFIDLPFLHSQNRTVKVNVFTACEFRMKPCH